jgi:hypothetical protein
VTELDSVLDQMHFERNTDIRIRYARFLFRLFESFNFILAISSMSRESADTVIAALYRPMSHCGLEHVTTDTLKTHAVG